MHPPCLAAPSERRCYKGIPLKKGRGTTSGRNLTSEGVSDHRVRSRPRPSLATRTLELRVQKPTGWRRRSRGPTDPGYASIWSPSPVSGIKIASAWSIAIA